MKGPSILLLQARRPEDAMKEHERECFVKHTGLDTERIACYDLDRGPPTLEEILDHDALMVGGSGDYYVSCFGYQCLVLALGGTIVHDPENTEVGTFELELTQAGRADPLFGHLPARFLAQLGHKDRAAPGPPDCPNLASSPRSPFQAFRIPGQPIWASQFHPELDREANADRYRHYLEGYAEVLGEAEMEAALAGFVESPEASSLLRRFLNLVFE